MAYKRDDIEALDRKYHQMLEELKRLKGYVKGWRQAKAYPIVKSKLQHIPLMERELLK